MVLQQLHKGEKWFCIASTSAESGSATLTLVRKVVFNMNTSAKIAFALLAQVWNVVLQQLCRCEMWLCIAAQV